VFWPLENETSRLFEPFFLFKKKLLSIFIDFAKPISNDSSENKSFGHDLLSLKFELLEVFICLWSSKFKNSLIVVGFH
jgi:hypothetical protein